MIIEYDSKYNEEIKDLLVQLQQHLVDIDEEEYNMVGDEYREKYFEKTMEDVKKFNGKILLYKDNERIVGLIKTKIKEIRRKYKFSLRFYNSM